PGHMPHLGMRRVDKNGLKLLREWIAGLPPRNDSDGTLGKALQQRRREEAAAVDSLLALAEARQGVPDDAVPLQRLLATTTGALELAIALDDAPLSEDPRRQLIAAGARNE